MKLYVDLETLQLIEGPGFRNPVSSLRFKRGDAALLEVAFLDGGSTAVAIGDPAGLEIRFGIKPRNRYDVGYLVHSAEWTMPEADAENPVYQSSPSFNTEQLDSALGVGSATGTELSEITLMGEITWREGAGEPTSTRTFLVVVENDVNRGTEGVPTSAEPPYPAPGNLVTALNRSPKVVADTPISTDEPLPAGYPILFHSGSDVWLLPAGQAADAAIPLTDIHGPIVMEWDFSLSGFTLTSPSAELPAGDYSLQLNIAQSAPDDPPGQGVAMLLGFSASAASSYSNIESSGFGQFSFFTDPLELYLAGYVTTSGGLGGSADLHIVGNSTVDIQFVDSAFVGCRLILTFTPT